MYMEQVAIYHYSVHLSFGLTLIFKDPYKYDFDGLMSI